MAAGAPGGGPISLTPDRTAAYLHRDSEALRGEIIRVSLADGSVEVVAEGMTPSLSPDGRTLACVGDNPENPDVEYRALHLLDLESGEITYVLDNACGGCARRIDQPAWSLDGSELYVAMGFEDGPIPDMDLLVVIPGTTTDLAAAAVFTPNDQFEHGAPGFPALLSDGSLAIVAVVNYGTGDSSDRFTAHWSTVEVFDIASAREIDALQFPELHSVDLADEVVTHTVDVASRPTTNGLAIVAQDWTDPMSPTFILYRWDGGAELREIARGIAAIAW